MLDARAEFAFGWLWASGRWATASTCSRRRSRGSARRASSAMEAFVLAVRSRLETVLGRFDDSAADLDAALALVPRLAADSNQAFQVLATPLLRDIVHGVVSPLETADFLLTFSEQPDTQWAGLVLRLAAARIFAVDRRDPERAARLLDDSISAVERAAPWAPNAPLVLPVRGRRAVEPGRAPPHRRRSPAWFAALARTRPPVPRRRTRVGAWPSSAPSRAMPTTLGTGVAKRAARSARRARSRSSCESTTTRPRWSCASVRRATPTIRRVRLRRPAARCTHPAMSGVASPSRRIGGVRRRRSGRLTPQAFGNTSRKMRAPCRLMIPRVWVDGAASAWPCRSIHRHS